MNTIPLRGRPYGGKNSPRHLLMKLGADFTSPDQLALSLPFSLEDATCGCENELQAVVIGSRKNVDLPATIETSNYFRNIIKRHGRGEMDRKIINELEYWLADNSNGVWENSWVRLNPEELSPLACEAWDHDLLADKDNPALGKRSDAERFFCHKEGRRLLRIPVSYLLKISLIDAVGSQNRLPSLLQDCGLNLAENFLSDNTSPETFSFHVLALSPEKGMGKEPAAETSRRFLLTQLLVHYANKKLKLEQSGQRVEVYFSPQPPRRQKQLSECISDAFYRELFMNPCLSGWIKGEEKYHYMHLCHQVLCRAQFNGLGRLKEAGIIVNNLVVLPDASNISLANNGTHISLGSHKLSHALSDPSSGFTTVHEKYLGDLVIKFVEHFLPLFVGAYSAAPHRLAFSDFHPEKVLSFLPYQLDYTHLRMIWRRWRKKADLAGKPLGLRLTPFGPPWLDRTLSRLFRMRGDFVPDFRLLDYLVCLMSTEQSPSLDGSLGNHQRLKQDLASLGVFDPRMPLYQLYRQRLYGERGFSGFEGRHYSLFYSFQEDLARAVELQCLLTALAYKLIAVGTISHDHIPDDPEVESERRQIFFGSAIGLPTFFVRADSRNQLLQIILKQTGQVRPSSRYHGYMRVMNHQFRVAAARFICQQGAELIECMGLEETMTDLIRRLEHPQQRTALGRLSRGVLKRLQAKDPLHAEAAEFNRAAEEYYRIDLRRKYLEEAFEVLERDLTQPDFQLALYDAAVRRALNYTLGNWDLHAFLQVVRGALITGSIREEDINRLINLLLLVIRVKVEAAPSCFQTTPRVPGDNDGTDSPPVYRQSQS